MQDQLRSLDMLLKVEYKHEIVISYRLYRKSYYNSFLDLKKGNRCKVKFVKRIWKSKQQKNSLNNSAVSLVALQYGKTMILLAIVIKLKLF